MPLLPHPARPASLSLPTALMLLLPAAKSTVRSARSMIKGDNFANFSSWLLLSFKSRSLRESRAVHQGVSSRESVG